MLHPAVFLDRDGTITRERGHICDPDDLELLPGSADAIRRLREGGWRVVVVTNQSHVARGVVTEADLQQMHRRLRELLDREGAAVDAVYHCPHHPEGTVAQYAVECDCRKPRPGLLQRAAVDLGLDLPQSVMVGDAARDVQAGWAAGVRACFLVRTGHGGAAQHEAHGATEVVDNLAGAAEQIRKKVLRRSSCRIAAGETEKTADI